MILLSYWHCIVDKTKGTQAFIIYRRPIFNKYINNKLTIMKRREAKELTQLADKVSDKVVRKEIIDKIQELKGSSIQIPDNWVYRLVIIALGSIVILCLIFTFSIVVSAKGTGTEKEIPGIFLAIGSAAVGALAGLLAPAPTKNG